MLISNTERKLLRLNLQFFGADGDAAADTTTTAAADTATATDAQAANANADNQQNNPPLTTEAIEKIIQSRVDKATAELGKKYALAQKENEQLKKDKMNADELAKYELEQEKKALATERKELTDKTNRLTAINELTKVELYDGSETATSLLNMVVNGAKEESEIADNVKAIKSVIDKMVAAQVQKKFKDNGRVPNGGTTGSEENKNGTSIAEKLGKQAAETRQKSNDILKHYYGG